MTIVFVAGVIAGCDVQTGNQTTPAAEGQRTKGTVQETELRKPIYPKSSQIQPFPDVEKETKTEPLIRGKHITPMTDVHYPIESLVDQGDMFQTVVEYGDEEPTNYVWEITDAVLEEIKLLDPDVLIISGDLSLQGERKSHEELAKKLDEVEKASITVLAASGNYDINNPSASVYSGGDWYPTEPATPRDFERICKESGYSEASSKDANSLSYTHDLGPFMRLFMLDAYQYEPRNRVGGTIKAETYEWIGEQLEQAVRDDVILLPVAHHNLLEESKIHVDGCIIKRSEELIQMLEGGNIPLFLSGHLHMQHFTRNSDISIYEVVTSSLSMPPCQYGVLDYIGGETFYYYTCRVNMEKWAGKDKSTDENLLNFNTYNPSVLKQMFYNQAYDAMKSSAEEETGSIFVKLTELEKQQMAEVYGDIDAVCYGGRMYEMVKEAVKRPGYSIWKECCYLSILYKYLEYIIEDAIQDYNVLSIK